MSKTRRKKSHIRKGEEEIETEDIYDDKQREEMLDEDEITAAENAFMQGREMKPKQMKGTKKGSQRIQYLLNLRKRTTPKTNGKGLVSC